MKTNSQKHKIKTNAFGITQNALPLQSEKNSKEDPGIRRHPGIGGDVDYVKVHLFFLLPHTVYFPAETIKV